MKVLYGPDENGLPDRFRHRGPRCPERRLPGAALYMTWQAWATDDGNLLPVEYWLDNGTFGKRNATHGKLVANNPYQEDKAVTPFKSLMDEIKALQKVKPSKKAATSSLLHCAAMPIKVDPSKNSCGPA